MFWRNDNSQDTEVCRLGQLSRGASALSKGFNGFREWNLWMEYVCISTNSSIYISTLGRGALTEIDRKKFKRKIFTVMLALKLDLHICHFMLRNLFMYTRFLF
ncbi:unnamed protein product [Ceratitis capitata]|uniref:(Mediterranean fruit fly) hypothetical protein n=1 Tax=Ceratitis capitata TaxID=7213 RepID=A0A811VGE6_CERCA|nr:unnamed protein product [Ceratitis capitata]